MQLKVLKLGVWKVVAPVNGNGCCEVEDQLVQLLANPKRKGYAVGFLALWERIPQFGPRQLPAALYHCVDEAHGIYEFIKGPLRLLCFEADGRWWCVLTFYESAHKRSANRTKHRPSRCARHF